MINALKLDQTLWFQHYHGKFCMACTLFFFFFFFLPFKIFSRFPPPQKKQFDAGTTSPPLYSTCIEKAYHMMLW